MTDQEHAEHIDFLCRTFGAEHVAYALGDDYQVRQAIEARQPVQPVQADMFAEVGHER